MSSAMEATLVVPSPAEWRGVLTSAREAQENEKILSVGQVIVGFSSLVEVDALSDLLIQANTGARYFREFDPDAYSLNAKGDRIYRGWRSDARRAIDTVPPKYFNGSIQNIQATLLDDVAVGSRNWSNLELEPRTTRYVLSADLVSSGRGVCGNIAKIVKIHSNVNGSKRIAPTISYRDIQGLNTQQAVDILIAESTANAMRVEGNGIKNVYLGGIPGLGKR